MLMSYIDKYNLLPGIKSLVLIGSGAVDKGQSLINEYPYKKINIPILDIYGEYDFNLVKKEANLPTPKKMAVQTATTKPPNIRPQLN